MAQLVTVRLDKSDHQPLGFRLQGGKDFGTPLVVQKVNGGSAAERAGLQAGDALIRVNSTDVYTLRHQEAQDTIRAAGPALELVVQRGGSTWRPSVTPTGSLPRPGRALGGAPTPVTSTSLKATPQPSRAFGSGHNSVAKPFGYMNGGDAVKGIVNKQYNTPVNMYSEQSIAETLSAQTEVLAGGVLGVNFKKNEKTYDAEKSAVFKMLQEDQSEPEPEAPSGPTPPVTGLRHVAAPVTRPEAPINNTGGLPPGQNICEECERLITGVFVRIKDKNLHVECFKCSTCGTSLKNQGYYNLNGKLYCDIHAKLVARQNPPAPNLEPVTVPPGSRIPTNTYSTPLPPLATNSYTNGSSLFSPSSNLSGPKPFGSSIGSAYSPSLSPRSAPLSPARPVAAPVSAPAPAPAPLHAPAAPFAPKAPVSLFKGSGVGGVGGAARGKTFGVSSAPKRGRGILNKAALPGSRVPLCASCNGNIRGPFITALGRIWCPEHFICVNASCRRQLQDIGFVEENGQLYCEYCFEQYIAPACDKCHAKIKGDCLNAIGKHFHPECFACVYCGKLFGNNPFFLEDGLPYCEADWNELFTTKCFACGFPVEAGDRCARKISKDRVSSPREADLSARFTPASPLLIYNTDTVYSTTTFRPVSPCVSPLPPAAAPSPAPPPAPSPQRTRKLETPLHFDGGLFSDIRNPDGKLLSRVTVDRVHSSTRRDVTEAPRARSALGPDGARDYVDDIVATETVTNEDVIKVKFTPVPPQLDGPEPLAPPPPPPPAPVPYIRDDFQDLHSYKLVSAVCKETSSFRESTARETSETLDVPKPPSRPRTPLVNLQISEQMTKIDSYLQNTLAEFTKGREERPASSPETGERRSTNRSTYDSETSTEYQRVTESSKNSYQQEQTNSYLSSSLDHSTPSRKESVDTRKHVPTCDVQSKPGVLRAVYDMPVHYHAAILCFILIVYNLVYQYIKENCHGKNK